MTAASLAALPWLPPPPHDFKAQCRQLANAEAEGDAYRRLAGHALDLNQLHRLATAIAAHRQAGGQLRPLTPFRLGLVGNATAELIVPALIATAARHGLALEVFASGFGQAAQEVLDPSSRLHRFKPDAVLLALDHRTLIPRTMPGDAPAAEAMISAALDHLTALRRAIRDYAAASSIVQTIARPLEPLFGSLDLVLPGTWRHLSETLNRALARSAAEGEMVLFDAACLAETIGLEHWHDPRQWALAKFAFAQSLVPIYAEHLCRLLAALRGKSRRCLVLDLDNTIWGGVVGDVGLEGIVLGEGDPVGEAFLEVQELALGLRRRGIILAVSSKNDDWLARRVFTDHPEMKLRLEHLAVFQANWSDKAANLKAIAEALSLGLESLVLLEDNPAERALVRQLLPTVAVPELPEDPALYARTLASAGYFEAVTFSAEDRQRPQFFADEARRLELAGQASDLSSYLASLGMTATFGPFTATALPRIAQLVNKSNQFNLTTQRYSEAELRALAGDPGIVTLQARLGDRFGDAGIIGVVICRMRRGGDEPVCEIDTWLMSCRALKRRVEEAMLCELVRLARQGGAKALVGRYVPSARNGLVREHYRVLGFAPLARSEDGVTTWRLELAPYRAPDVPIKIVHEPRAARPLAAAS